jgi:spermidine synthase
MATLAVASPVVRTKRTGAALLLALYGMTGFSGLLAEQGFERYISLLVGTTASASAVVLFTYFLGFALGGLGAARYLKHRRIRNPLRLYGFLELLVGAGSVAFTYLFHDLVARLAPWQNLFESALGKQSMRFAFGCLLILPVAALMGASFPLIAQALDNSSAGKRHWTSAYAANLAGAAMAALVAPFFIMPLLGLQGAMWLCFAICVSVFICTATLPKRDAGSWAPDEASRLACPPHNDPVYLLLIAAFFSGAVFFALEVIWTHLIGAVLGGSVYSFSSMLVMVLLGLLIGALLVRRGVQTGKMVQSTVLFQISGLLLLVQFRLWDVAPFAFAGEVSPAFTNFYAREGYRLCVAALLILPSASALGLIYPRLLASTERAGGPDARMAGYMSAANSVGCLTGALLSTFLLIPVLGSELSLKVIIVILTALWAAFYWLGGSRGRRRTMSMVAGMSILLVLTASWHWQWARISSGYGQYFGESISKSRKIPGTPAASIPISSRIIYQHEGMQGGFTSVVETSTVSATDRTLTTDGKFLGSDHFEYEGQLSIAALPSLFVQNLDRSLLIGLGTGHSAEVLRKLGYRSVEIAEFSRDVVEAARCCFQHINQNVLSDPRVKLHVEDGRNVMLTSSRQYDLITIQINAIWYAGATNVFSREFYELARKRLRPGGVLQQWVQLHRIGSGEVASAIATARAVFPYVAFWVYGGEGNLIAADRPLVVEENRKDYIKHSLERTAGISPERAAELVRDFDLGLVLGSDGVDRMVTALHPIINTDQNRWIEYAAPRYSSGAVDWKARNIRFLAQWSPGK